MESNSLPFVARVPDFYQCVLHDVFGFLSVESNAQSQSEEFVLQWQNVSFRKLISFIPLLI